MTKEPVAGKDFWEDIERCGAERKSWQHAVRQVRKDLHQAVAKGKPVGSIEGSLLEQKRREVLSQVAAVEKVRAAECAVLLARIEAERTRVVLADEYLLDNLDAIEWDLETLELRNRLLDFEADGGTLRQTAEAWKALLAEMLQEPLVALRMAQDEALPEWTRELALRVSNTNGEDEEMLAPNLRKELEGWLAAPEKAERFLEAAQQLGWPEYLRQAARVLALLATRGNEMISGIRTEREDHSD